MNNTLSSWNVFPEVMSEAMQAAWANARAQLTKSPKTAPPAFKEQLVALQGSLHSFSRSLARDVHRGEDLAQEATRKALENWEKFRPGSNFKGWVFTIAYNEHYSRLRRRKFEADAGSVNLDYLPELSVGDTTRTGVEYIQTKRIIDEALASMQPEKKTALLAVTHDGMSYEEAATHMGCALGTAKSRVSRARETLKQHLIAGGVEDCSLT